MSWIWSCKGLENFLIRCYAETFNFGLYLIFLFRKTLFKMVHAIAHYQVYGIWRRPPLHVIVRYSKPWHGYMFGICQIIVCYDIRQMHD